MKRNGAVIHGVVVLLIGMVPLVDVPTKGEGKTPVKMGMIQSLFRGKETYGKLAQMSSLGDSLLSGTGIEGKVTVVAEPAELVRQVQNNELDLAVMHGIEFAWVRAQFPDVQPLVLACNRDVRLKAFLMVRQGNPATKVADLQGKPFSFPKNSLNHTYLFVHRVIQDAHLDPAGFFGPSPVTANNEEGLDDVVDGVTAVVAVDEMAWEVYKDRKPGRARKLRTLCESDWFPTATVVYSTKSPDVEKAASIQAQLLAADQTTMGRQMLTLWRLTQFRLVPSDYAQLLNDVAANYPTPFEPASFIADRRRRSR